MPNESEPKQGTDIINQINFNVYNFRDIGFDDVYLKGVEFGPDGYYMAKRNIFKSGGSKNVPESRYPDGFDPLDLKILERAISMTIEDFDLEYIEIGSNHILVQNSAWLLPTLSGKKEIIERVFAQDTDNDGTIDKVIYEAFITMKDGTIIRISPEEENRIVDSINFEYKFNPENDFAINY
jgi:hypothetical protein